MAMFDPNQALPDFEQQQTEVDRQRKLAEFLRKRSIDQPTMQMVGNIAVKPHWLERLVPLLNQYQAGQADRNASSAEQSMLKQQKENADQWRMGMPQATPGIPGMAGSDDTPGGMPQVSVPAQPVDRNTILKYTMAGLNNPRTAKEAMLANQSLTSDLTREEDKVYKTEERQSQDRWRAQESELARTQGAELKREALAQAAELKREQLVFQERQLVAQMADRNLSREQQLVVSKMLDATRRELAGAANDARAGRVSDAKEAKEAKALADKEAKDEATTQKHVQRLSHDAVNLAPLREAAIGIQDLLDSAPRKPDGTSISIPGLGRENFLSPLIRSEQGNVNRQKVQKFANAVLRAQAGLSQTLSEQERVDLELMASGKFTQKEFERAWPATISKLNTQLGNLRAGVPKNALVEYGARGGPALDDVAAKPYVALPKATAEQMPEGMDPARWARLQELRKAAGGGK